MLLLAVVLAATIPEVSTFAVVPLLRSRSLLAHSSRSSGNAVAPTTEQVVSTAKNVARRPRSILRAAADEPGDASASSSGGVWNDMEVLVEIKGGIKVIRRCSAHGPR